MTSMKNGRINVRIDYKISNAFRYMERSKSFLILRFCEVYDVLYDVSFS